MSDQGFHLGPTAPTSLDAASTFEINLGKASSVTLKPVLYSHPSYQVHFRIDYASGMTATALTTAEHTLTHLEGFTVQLCPTTTSYLYVLLTDATGTTQNGGTSDRLLKLEVG